jgi:molybdopterin synthase catalytic subunit
MVRVQHDPIDPGSVIESVRSKSSGGLAVFIGTVRNNNDGRNVSALEYHAYEGLAAEEMQAVVDRVRGNRTVDLISAVHRLGRLELGEIAVVVAVSSAHRAEAFDSCREVIEALKHSVPIWKKEHFDGGEVWIEGGA